MSDSTVYDIRIQYLLDDRASGGLDHLSSKADEAGHHAEGLKETLKGIGEAFLVGEGFAKGKEFFIDFNREMESMRISAAAMLQANDLAKNFEQATDQAQKLTAEYQRFAVTSPVTTKDINEFSNGIMTAVAQAGGGIDMIQNFAEQGVIAAKAFGENADIASRQISEAISRGARANEVFSKVLITTQNVTLKAFNDMDPKERLDVLTKALNSPAMKEAAKAFGDSFEGVTSTLKDNIEIGFGKIGLPLFKAITAEVAQWNKWIEEHPREIQEFSDKFSKALVDGFHAVKDAVSFVVDHKDLFLKLAEAWLFAKVAGAGGGAVVGGKALGGLAGAGANLGALGLPFGQFMKGQNEALLRGAPSAGDVLKGALSGYALGQLGANFTEVSKGAQQVNDGMHVVEGALSTLPGPIGLVGSALMGLHTGLQMFADWIDRNQKERIEKHADLESVRGDLRNHDTDRVTADFNRFTRAADQGAGVERPQTAKEMAAAHDDLFAADAALIDKVRELGAFTKEGTFSADIFNAKLKEMGFAATNAAKITETFSRDMDMLAQVDPELLKRRFGASVTPTADRGVENGKKAAPTHVNVHINRIEVQSDDPDRFVFGLVRSFSSAVKSPGAARGALRGGF